MFDLLNFISKLFDFSVYIQFDIISLHQCLYIIIRNWTLYNFMKILIFTLSLATGLIAWRDYYNHIKIMVHKLKSINRTILIFQMNTFLIREEAVFIYQFVFNYIRSHKRKSGYQSTCIYTHNFRRFLDVLETNSY